jgi:hypothetical protein
MISALYPGVLIHRSQVVWKNREDLLRSIALLERILDTATIWRSLCGEFDASYGGREGDM